MFQKIPPLAAVIVVAALSPAFAQQIPTSPTPSPTPRSLSPQQEQKVKEMAARIQERTGNATDKVFGGIQKLESEVYLKFLYFIKPSRLDPNSYATKDELAKWQTLLRELGDKESTLETAYTNAEIDLGNALIQQQISLPAAMQIKKTLVASIPWEIIKSKSQLMHDFLGEHAELLNFYEQHWGSWKSGPGPDTAQFDSPDLTNKYQNLKSKIAATTDQLKTKYQALLQ